MLAIDRIGDGQSSHPPSSQIVYPNTIYTLHQVVDNLRNGTLGTKFDSVIEVGHSAGSDYAVDEQSTYQDAEALILTGYGHKGSPSFRGLSESAQYPALDPKFANSGLGTGYLTTKPGKAGPLYFYLPGADPNVIALNEKLKDTVELAEYQSGPDISKLAPNIHVPTLIFNGQHDIIFCAADADDCSTEQSFYQAESPYFASAACLRAMIMPNAGHNVALHYSAPESDGLILGWARKTLPSIRFENDGHAPNGPGPFGQIPGGHATRCHGTGPLVTKLPEQGGTTGTSTYPSR